MTAAVIFVGPTISATEVQALLPQAKVLPPAARGDVFRAAKSGAGIIGIVDGVFERVPSVWHKEVLWALEQGIRVLGSSSMGALRAAELDVFGMQGIGRVYKMVADGSLDDDDVAVVHAPAEFDHQCLSTAMVNLRLTLRAAVAAGVMPEHCARELDDAQKQRFYSERSVATMLQDAEAVAPEHCAAFAAWIDDHFVDQKYLDARELVEHIATLGQELSKPQKRPLLERTAFFEKMVKEETGLGPTGSIAGYAHPVIEELQIRPSAYTTIAASATHRRYSRELAMRSGLQIDQELIDRTSDRLRRELGLYEPEDLDDWLSQMSMSFDDWTALVDRQARADVGQAMLPPLPEADIVDEIRLDGRWPQLAELAAQKATHLREFGYDEVGAGSDPADRDRAMEWWLACSDFGHSHAVDDPQALAVSLGFDSAEALSDAVLRAYRHVQFEEAK